MLINLSQNANSTRCVAERNTDKPIFYSANFSSKGEAKVEKIFSESTRLARSKALKKRALKTRR